MRVTMGSGECGRVHPRQLCMFKSCAIAGCATQHCSLWGWRVSGYLGLNTHLAPSVFARLVQSHTYSSPCMSEDCSNLQRALSGLTSWF